MQTTSISFAFVLFALSLGCEAQRDKSADKSEVTVQAESESPNSIGEATMNEDGTLVLQLRAEAPGGGSGDALFEYKPDNPDYQKTLDHIGGLEPGQSKPVPPWPEKKINPK